MKRCLFVILLLGLTATLCAQERERMTNSSEDNGVKIKESYFVLSSDKVTRDGAYQLFQNEKLVAKGYYMNGKKDSTWEIYNPKNILVSIKYFKAGEKTGKWEFYNDKGEAEWTYDFNTGEASYQKPPTDTVTFYYQSDAGAWVREHLDKDPLPLNGSGEWRGFMLKNFRYPMEAMSNEQQGDVIVSIAVDENGNPTGYNIFQSAAPSLDAEAMRMIKGFHYEFIPAVKNGKKVKVQYHLPVKFRIDVDKPTRHT
jgi:TonB family protein